MSDNSSSRQTDPNEPLTVEAFLAEKGLTPAQIADIRDEFEAKVKAAYVEKYGVEPPTILVDRDGNPVGVNHSPCDRWCAEGECEPDEGFHVGANLLATKGGPMGDEHTDRTVDLVPTVSVQRYDSDMAEIRLYVGTWLRNTSGWGVPGELIGLIPPVGMSAVRARQVASLLLDAADQVDKLNDATAASVNDLRFLGSLLPEADR